VNVFNRLSKVEREYLIRENKPLHEIKTFNKIFSALRREMKLRLINLLELDRLISKLKVEHFLAIKVYQINKGFDLNMLILKTLLKSKTY
jgi:hypothetical protein